MPEEKTFYFSEDGGELEFNVTVDSKGNATITVTKGSADFNAIYWDDGEGGDAGLDGPLNMNGGGSRDEDGNAIDWNGAAPLSMPGLGNDGPRQFDGVFDEDGNKTTYLEQGETLEIELDWGEGFDFDNLTNIGIRATSVGDDGGSIKAVSSPGDDPEEPEVPDDPVGSEKVMFFFKNPENDELKAYTVQNGHEGGVPFTGAVKEIEETVLADFLEASGYEMDDLAGIAHPLDLDYPNTSDEDAEDQTEYTTYGDTTEADLEALRWEGTWVVWNEDGEFDVPGDGEIWQGQSSSDSSSVLLGDADQFYGDEDDSGEGSQDEDLDAELV